MPDIKPAGLDKKKDKIKEDGIKWEPMDGMPKKDGDNKEEVEMTVGADKVEEEMTDGEVSKEEVAGVASKAEVEETDGLAGLAKTIHRQTFECGLVEGDAEDLKIV